MAGLLTDSLSGAFPEPISSGKSIYPRVLLSFTAAGLFGISTRFPFNPTDGPVRSEPIRSKDKKIFQKAKRMKKGKTTLKNESSSLPCIQMG